MKKIPLILFILSILFVLFSLPSKVSAKTESSGDLQVTWEDPLFPSSIIWYPGLSVTKSFTVKNLGSSLHPASIQAANTSETGDVSQVFLFKITEGVVARYGGSDDKTLKNFWDEGQISLSDLNGGSSNTYDITITMLASAGNEYQGKQAKFDFIIGFVGTPSQVVITGGGAGALKSFSNGLSATPTGGFLASLPPGFAPGVLGVATPEAKLTATPIGALKPTKAGEIKGEKAVNVYQVRLFWLILLTGIVLSFFFYFSFLKKYKSKISKN